MRDGGKVKAGLRKRGNSNGNMTIATINWESLGGAVGGNELGVIPQPPRTPRKKPE